MDIDTNAADIRNRTNGALGARFYEEAVKNSFKSEQTGRPIFDTKLFVEIVIPGDFGGTVVHEVTEEHRLRFPDQWRRFAASREGIDTGEIGTPLKMWSILRPHMVAELVAMNFTHVESIAHASDAGLSSIGNLAGMSATALRDRARAYIAGVQGKEVALQSEDLKKENDDLRARMVAMEETRARLAATPMTAPPVPVTVTPFVPPKGKADTAQR